jgi:hypothetical protein
MAGKRTVCIGYSQGRNRIFNPKVLVRLEALPLGIDHFFVYNSTATAAAEISLLRKYSRLNRIEKLIDSYVSPSS